jgi:hypothetical protein
MAVAIKHITDPVPHIHQTNPKLPEAMDTIIQKTMAKDKTQRFSTAVEMTDALREAARGTPTKFQTTLVGSTRETIPAGIASVQPIPAKRGFNALFVIVPVIAIAALAGGFFFFRGNRNSPPMEPPISTLVATSTSAPLPTDTSAPIDTLTNIPIVAIEPTITETSLPATPTETTVPALPALGGADKIAFVANNEIWAMNVDGSELKQLTADGGTRTIYSGFRTERTLFY